MKLATFRHTLTALALFLAIAGVPVPVQASPDDCSGVCPEIWQPVCGSDGKTYGNACHLTLMQCQQPALTQAHEGECDESAYPSHKPACTTPSTPTCPIERCEEIFRPVCGSDNVTYSNACELKREACEDDALTQLYAGQCEDSPISPTEPTTCAVLLCREFSECKVDDATGDAYCADICSEERCQEEEGTTCELQTVTCVKAPCPPVAVCVPMESDGSGSETE